MSKQAIIVIPARMASTRFPDKPLIKIKGKEMIRRVWEIACAIPSASEVLIATDDVRLQKFAEGFGARVIMTSAECLTGTDRVAEVSSILNSAEETIFFNLQGDAVLTPPWIIEETLQVLLEDASIQMATPAVRLREEALEQFVAHKQQGSSSGTCVTFDKKGNALYFSKALIPYARSKSDCLVYQHIGLYGYRVKTLRRLCALPEGFFEKVEKLEQLRALENGIPIRVVEVDYKGRTPASVDRPEDVAFVEALIEKEGELLCS